MQKSADGLLWKENSRKKLASTAVFDLYLSTMTSQDGRRGDFAVMSAPDWVNVVPVLRGPSGDERFLMVRQYRHGIGRVTTEFPAGLANPGEDPAAAAARELREETGMTAGRLSFLGKISPNPAFMDNWCHTYLAEDLTDSGGQELDRLEILRIVEVPRSELTASLGAGEYVNSLVMTALLWYTLRKVPTE